MHIRNISLIADAMQPKTLSFSNIVSKSDVTSMSEGLVDGSLCNKCDNSAIHYASTIGCGKCSRRFHIPCLTVPIDREILAAINSNPCLWWVCMQCLTDQDAKTSPGSQEVVDIETRISKNLEKALESFKRDIISVVDNKCNQALSSNPTNSKGTKRKSDDGDDLNASKAPRTISSDTTPFCRIPSTPVIHNYAAAASHHQVQNKVKPSSRRDSFRPNQANCSNNAPKKFILHYKPLIDKRLILNNEEWYQLRRKISEKLTSVKMTFSHFNTKTGKFVLGFPNNESRQSAEESLKDLVEMWCFESYVPIKMLPKLTIHNVPLDFDYPDNPDSTSAGNVLRDQVKGEVWQTIVEKNEGIKSLVENGACLEIVYLKTHNFTSTVAIKVSPELRLHILEQCNAKLFLFSGCCKVSDRCHYKQCYYCLKFGHFQNECPNKNDGPNCRYCAEKHDSRTCTQRDAVDSHICLNCKNSKSPEHSQNFNHNACSSECGIIKSIMNRIQQNTQLQVASKK